MVKKIIKLIREYKMYRQMVKEGIVKKHSFFGKIYFEEDNDEEI